MSTQEPNVDGGDAKNTSAEEIKDLETRVQKEEETASKSEDYVAKKKAELEQRRKDAEERKKKARIEAKQVKKELNSDDSEKDTTDTEKKEEETQPEENETVEAPLEDEEEERYERYKLRMREEEAQKTLQSKVDTLVTDYPEASVDQLTKIENLVPELQKHYPELSIDQLVSKAVYLELGEQPVEDTVRNKAVDASGSSVTGGAQKSNSTSYQFEILPSHRESVKKSGYTEEEFLKVLERRYNAGEDITKYGGRKIK